MMSSTFNIHSNFETREKFLTAIKSGEDISDFVKMIGDNIDIISDGFNVALLNEKYETAKYFMSLSHEVLEDTETGPVNNSMLRDVDYHKIMIICGIRKKYDQLNFLLSELGDSPLLKMGFEGLYHLSVKDNNRELFDLLTSYGIPISLTPEDIEDLKIRLQKFRNSGKHKLASDIEGGLKLIGIEA